MNEEKNKLKKIIITENDEYEGKFTIDYLISSLNDMRNKIEKIHLEMSEMTDKLEKENKNENLLKDQEEIINEEFKKCFKIENNNQEKILDYLNDINQKHKLIYRKIFNSLNIDLVPVKKTILNKNENLNLIQKENNNIEKEIKLKLDRNDDIKNEKRIVEKDINKNIDKKNKK